MAKQSAGVILYKVLDGEAKVLLVHPGGPFWAKKDLGAWSIPKGEFMDSEETLTAAYREFREELGSPVPDGQPMELQPIKQSGGKTVYAWVINADFNASNIRSNTFEMEWPFKSGKQQSFPEVDKAAWFSLADAKQKIVKGQVALLEQVETKLNLEPSVAVTTLHTKVEKPGQTQLF